jgi:hypothetical protein
MKIQEKILIVASFIILFCGIFYDLASRTLFDYDFWWHISTGRYIVETHSIPASDPFSFTSEMPENKNLFPERENFILKQYWLAQVLFYLIYDLSGPKGMILLRALMLSGMLLLVLYRLRKWDVSFYVSFISVFLLFAVASRHIGERPVLFTILFTPLTFIILEGFKSRQKKFIFFLPPLMLLWANLHGGFIIGIGVILVFMAGEGLKIILKQVRYTRNEVILFYTATILALFLSYINPSGWDAFSIALSPEYKFMEEGIQEYASLFYIYKERLYPINYGSVGFLCLFPIILIARNKKMDITHILLLSGFFIMALRTGRYDVYYAAMASMILGRETDLLLKDLFKNRLPERIRAKMISALVILTFLSATLFVVGFTKIEAFKFDLATGYSVPKAAVDFIEKNKIEGRILNDAGLGGYVTWRLYPWKKTFIDTRWLNYTPKVELYWVLNARDSREGRKIAKGKKPLWERMLEHYDINIIFTGLFDVYGQVMPVVLTLMEGDKWVPVYGDAISIVFVKNIPRNHDIITKYKRTKEYIYGLIIAKACVSSQISTENPKYVLSIAQTFYKMGRLKESITAYEYALKRSPHKEEIRKEIEKIEDELKEKTRNERN